MTVPNRPGPIPPSVPSRQPVSNRDLLSNPASIGALAMAVLMALPLLVSGGAVLFLTIGGLGVVLVALTITSGAHQMVAVSGLFLFFVGTASIEVFDGGGSPLPWLILAVILLLYTDVVRISFLTRRRAVVSDSAPGSILAGTAMATALALVLFIFAAGVDSDQNRSWLWVPLATFVIAGFVAVVLVVAAHRPGHHDTRRWNPGERMPPPPTVD